MKPALLIATALLLTVNPARAESSYPSALPDESTVAQLLGNSPLVSQAAAGLSLGEALRRQRLSGPHSWATRATTQERRDKLSNERYTEMEFALERGVRLPGKASLDTELGEQALHVATFSYADVWHEAGRLLLSSWFEWLRAAEEVNVLQAQIELLTQHRDAVQRRVTTGDAPALEGRLAEAELNRVIALGVHAEERQQQRALDLAEHFPGIVLTVPQGLEPPPVLEGSDTTWRERIVGDNHELKLAESRQREAELLAQRARLDRIPDPTIGVHYGQERDEAEKVLGVSIIMPFGGAARRAEHAAALAQAAIATQRTREARLRAEGDASRAINSARLSRTRWEQLDRLAAEMTATAATMRRGYELGELDLSTTLTTQRQSLDASLDAHQALLDALEAYSRLRLDAHEIWMLDHDHQAP